MCDRIIEETDAKGINPNEDKNQERIEGQKYHRVSAVLISARIGEKRFITED